MKKIMKEWVNLKTQDDVEFTALHFAAFNGDSQSIDILLKQGANPSAKSKENIGMMHVAAQNNQVYSLSFFRAMSISAGMNDETCLGEKDSDQATPLHWACDNGSDVVIFYLLAWISKGKYIHLINIQQSNGRTPLHLAVIKAEDLITLGAIKELLIQGADRNAKDQTGRIPYDYIAEISQGEVRKELYHIFVSLLFSLATLLVG